MSNNNGRNQDIGGQYHVTLNVDSDMAQANGKGKNNVNSVFQSTESGHLTPGLKVNFKIKSGNAVFAETQSPRYATSTNGVGQASAAITSRTVGVVEVGVEAAEDENSSALARVTFTEPTNEFAIREVINVNHSFGPNQPSIAWQGATFKIITHGGSRNCTWEAVTGSAELSVDGSPDGDAAVTFRARPRTLCEIRGTDNVTGETVSHYFMVGIYITTDGKKHTYSSANGDHGSYMLTPKEYEQLHHQWGDMSSYAVWNTTDGYWTSERSGTKVKVFNMVDGTIKNINIGLGFDKLFYCYKIDN